MIPEDINSFKGISNQRNPNTVKTLNNWDIFQKGIKQVEPF